MGNKRNRVACMAIGAALALTVVSLPGCAAKDDAQGLPQPDAAVAAEGEQVVEPVVGAEAETNSEVDAQAGASALIADDDETEELAAHYEGEIEIDEKEMRACEACYVEGREPKK